MANYDYGHDRLPECSRIAVDVAVWWSGIAGYIKYAPNDKWAFATRGEYFSDNDGFSDRNASEPERIHPHTAAHAGQQDHDPAGIPA